MGKRKKKKEIFNGTIKPKWVSRGVSAGDSNEGKNKKRRKRKGDGVRQLNEPSPGRSV